MLYIDDEMDFQLNASGVDDLSAEGLYHCPLCENSFDTKDLLEDHLDNHQRDREILECDFCGKEFTSKLELTKHTALHAQESQNDPQCQICGKYFGTREEAVMHLKIHSAGGSPGRVAKQRKFKCERCDRSFFTRKDVKRHMVVHTGHRNFVCQYCPQKFGRKDHLVRHTKKTHSNNNNHGSGSNNNNSTVSNNNTTSGLNQQSLGQSPPVPLSDPGVSSTTGLLPPEPAPPQSPLIPSMATHPMMPTHSVPTTPTGLKQEANMSSVFNYGDMSPAGQQPFHDDGLVPPSHHLTALATTSASQNVNQQSVTVLPLGGQNIVAANSGILQTGKETLVSPWPNTAYISPSFSSYFIDDENRNSIPLVKHDNSCTSIASNNLSNHSGLATDFHPSSTSSSYFTLMPIISQNSGSYYNVQGSVVGNLSPLSPTSPQTTTPLTPPLVDGLGSPLPHFSQAFQ